MPFARPLITCTILATGWAAPALADLTAAGLWEDWQAAATKQGVTLSAEAVTETGSGLEITGIAMVLAEGTTDDAEIIANVPQLTLSEAGDGTVLLAMPGGKQITFIQPGAVPERAVLRVDTAGLTATASGTRAEPLYTWAAPSVSAELTEFDPGPSELDASLSVNFTDFGGRVTGYTPTGTDPLTALFEAGEASWSLSFTDPAESAQMTTEASQTNLVVQAEAVGIPEDGSPPDQFRLALDSGAGTTVSTQSFQGVTQRSETSHESANLRMDGTGENALFTLAATDIGMSIDDPALPFRPAAASLGELDFAYAGPLEDADTAQPFDLTIQLLELSPAETVWTSLDPTGVMPRTPMNLSVDLTGNALIGAAAQVPGMPPGAAPEFAPTDVTIKQLDLTYGEASAKATGAFTLPTPAEVVEAGPFAQLQPAGRLEVVLTGAIELLSQLAQTGLVPQQQMMGVQMMLGMFATPQSDGSLRSVIETTSDGGLSINGNKLR